MSYSSKESNAVTDALLHQTLGSARRAKLIEMIDGLAMLETYSGEKFDRGQRFSVQLAALARGEW